MEWIPVKEKAAPYRCIACDKFGQIFLPTGVLTYETDKREIHCFDANGYEFDDKKFFKGIPYVMNGKTVYIEPREIIAWIPLPEPYKVKP